MRKYYPSKFIALAACLFFIGSNTPISYSHKENTTDKDSTVTISISAVGDLMCHSVQFDYARVAKDSFDFRPVYGKIKKYLDSSDLIMGNLETVTAGADEKYTGYPKFNSPDAYIAGVKYAGFNLITTANNHALDRGEKGILRTIEQLKKNGINYEGTFTSKRDQDSIRIFDLKGINTAVLAFTYGTNGNKIPAGKKYLINVIDTAQIRDNIRSARKEGAELVAVYFHFGTEYKREPTEFQRKIVEKTISYGADIILGGHPHVIEPAAFYKTHKAKLDSGFVIYSLGNFISNQSWRYSDAGVVLTIKITKDIPRDSLYISSVNFLPTWVFKGPTDEGNRYYILPDEPSIPDTAYNFLTSEDKIKMHQAFEDTKDIITRYTKRIKLR